MLIDSTCTYNTYSFWKSLSRIGPSVIKIQMAENQTSINYLFEGTYSFACYFCECYLFTCYHFLQSSSVQYQFLRGIHKSAFILQKKPQKIKCAISHKSKKSRWLGVCIYVYYYGGILRYSYFISLRYVT